MSFEIGDRVELKKNSYEHPGEKAEVVYRKLNSDLLLVKFDNNLIGWTGSRSHDIPDSLYGTSGLWWVYPIELEIVTYSDPTYPGYDID